MFPVKGGLIIANKSESDKKCTFIYYMKGPVKESGRGGNGRKNSADPADEYKNIKRKGKGTMHMTEE